MHLRVRVYTSRNVYEFLFKCLLIINIRQLHFQLSTRARSSPSSPHLLALFADALCASIIRLFQEELCESTTLLSNTRVLHSYLIREFPLHPRGDGAETACAVLVLQFLCCISSPLVDSLRVDLSAVSFY